MAGLKAHVFEQDGIGKRLGLDGGGMVDRFPPAEEMEQAVRIAANRERSHAAEGEGVEISIHPIDLAAGVLLDDAERAACGIGGGLVETS